MSSIKVRLAATDRKVGAVHIHRCFSSIYTHSPNLTPLSLLSHPILAGLLICERLNTWLSHWRLPEYSLLTLPSTHTLHWQVWKHMPIINPYPVKLLRIKLSAPTCRPLHVGPYLLTSVCRPLPVEIPVHLLSVTFPFPFFSMCKEPLSRYIDPYNIWSWIQQIIQIVYCQSLSVEWESFVTAFSYSLVSLIFLLLCYKCLCLLFWCLLSWYLLFCLNSLLCALLFLFRLF